MNNVGPRLQRSFGFILLVALSLMPVLAEGQVTLTVTASGTPIPGAAITGTVALSGSTGQNIQAIGGTLPAAASAVTAGVASTAASKTLWTSGSNFALLGWTNPAAPATPVPSVTPYADGVALSFTVTIPASAAVGSTIPVTLLLAHAANGSGTSIPVTVAPANVTVVANPSCTAAISANVSSYLLAPTAPLLGTTVLELASLKSTGTCQ